MFLTFGQPVTRLRVMVSRGVEIIGGALISTCLLGFLSPSGARFARHGPGGASDARRNTVAPGEPGSPKPARVHRQGGRLSRAGGSTDSISGLCVVKCTFGEPETYTAKRHKISDGAASFGLPGRRLIVEARGGAASRRAAELSRAARFRAGAKRTPRGRS